MKAMLRLQVQRKNEQGKQSIFYIQGRPVENKKLERYVRRKGLSEADIMAWNARASRSPLLYQTFYLFCFSSSRSPLHYMSDSPARDGRGTDSRISGSRISDGRE
jgi:hypothetical protein